MPREYRELHFSAEETTRAIHRFAVLTSGPDERPGPPSELRIRHSTDLLVEIKFGMATREFQELEITAALINYAREHGIPMPRKSRKELDYQDDHIVLKMNMN